MATTSLHYLLLFAKYPYYGKVKTRLEPALGTHNAQIFASTALLEVLQYFGRMTGEKVGEATCICVWCYAPSAAGDDVRQFLSDNGLAKKWEAWPQEDSASDLGDRLSAAVQRAAKEVKENSSLPKSTCTLIGSDCFQLTTSHVSTSMQTALSSRVSLLPAQDGGYVLLSLPLPASDSSFDNIRWSSPETARDQKLQLIKMGYEVDMGETLSDVDEPIDLQNLLELCQGEGGGHLKTAYPRTIDFVQQTAAT